MEMHGLEKTVLKSAVWRLLATKLVLPWVLSVGVRPATDVLEIGTGAGFNAEALLKRFDHWRLVATDFDPEMVELSQRRLSRFGSSVSVQTADATSLPFGDNSFDLVISVIVWHHVGDWRKATREAARVLRPSGNLLIADIYGHHSVGPLSRALADLPPYGKEDLLSALTEAGFQNGHLRQFGKVGYSVIASRTVS